MKVTHYKDAAGVVFTQLVNIYGYVVVEARGKFTLKQMIKKYNEGC